MLDDLHDYKRNVFVELTGRLFYPLVAKFGNFLFPGSRYYWERRYAIGGNSGAGSYAYSARYKAKFINNFIKTHKLSSVTELGCGDGNQLAMFNIRKYIGLDVSKKAVSLCKLRFCRDKKKHFYLFDSSIARKRLFRSDLSLSLDVIYHLIEEEIFRKYMRSLFASATQFVIIYSTNIGSKQRFHVKHRKFTDWVEKNIKDWKLVQVVKSKSPNDLSLNFYVYKKKVKI